MNGFVQAIRRRSDAVDPHCGDNLMLSRWRSPAGFGRMPISRLFSAYIIRRRGRLSPGGRLDNR
jgi:hypothetical protein